MPVPIFFIFKLDSLLTYSGVEFSEMAQSGGGAPLYSSAEDFAGFDFPKIYGTGYLADPSQEKKYRHAEILCPDFYPIDNSIAYICCRNDVERQTLLNLISRESFLKYNNIIRSANKTDSVFEKNGLFIENCLFDNGWIIITFNNSFTKKSYYNYSIKHGGSEYEPDTLKLTAKVHDPASGMVFEWITPIHDYLTTQPVYLDVSQIKLSENVYLELYLSDSSDTDESVMMAKVNLSLAKSVFL